MVSGIILIILGFIVGRIGVRFAGRSAGFISTTSGGVTVGHIDAGEVARGKNAGERLMGQLMKLVGVIAIVYGVYLILAHILSH